MDVLQLQYHGQSLQFLATRYFPTHRCSLRFVGVFHCRLLAPLTLPPLPDVSDRAESTDEGRSDRPGPDRRQKGGVQKGGEGVNMRKAGF